MGFLGRAVKFWLILLMIVLSVYVAYFNRTFIPISLPPFIESMNLPAFLVYIVWLMTGSLLTWGFLGVDLLKKSWKIRRLTKQVRDLGGAPHLDSASESGQDKRGKSDSTDPYTRRNDVSIY